MLAVTTRDNGIKILANADVAKRVTRELKVTKEVSISARNSLEHIFSSLGIAYL